MIKRRETKEVCVGSVYLGSSHPLAVQTMYSERLDNSPEKLLSTLRSYATMGCSLIRFSYSDSQQKEQFKFLCQHSPMPMVADIHFDWKLAIEALELGFHKIRINPGNIGSKQRVQEIVNCASDHGAAIRIGLNGGSLPRKRRSDDHAQAMVETALEYVNWFESWGFYQTVISVKDTDVETTYRAYKNLADLCDYPLHLGVTEAGGLVSAVTRSTWVLGRLLEQGIGDTLRISITDDVMYEIAAAKEIMRTVGLETSGIRIVSCPRCGRSSFDSQGFLKKIEPRLLEIQTPLTVAIMGCQVNGPGEAAMADIALTGMAGRIYLYEKGKLVKEIAEAEAEEVLFERIRELSDA